MRFACAALLLGMLGVAACSSSETATAAPAAKSVLPAIETACKSDGDCEYSYIYEIDGKCCDGTCSPRAANRGYLEKVEAVCKRVGHADNCPVKKCKAPSKIGCVSGTCSSLVK